MSRVVQYVGMAKSTRADHSADFPVWTLNESSQQIYLKRMDAVFQIHEHEDFSRENNLNHLNHYAWLRNEPDTCKVCEGTGFAKDKKTGVRSKVKRCPDCKEGIYIPDRRIDFPIYMQEAYPEIPGAVKYPLEEIIERVRFPIRGLERIKNKYFTSSLNYAQGLVAVSDDIDEIRIYGVEASSDTEYAGQKAGIEFWGGYLGGIGKVVWVPEKCRLFNSKLYGYEVSMNVSRQELERYQRHYKKEHEATKESVFKMVGRLTQIEQMIQATNSPQQKQHLASQHQELRQKLADQQAVAQATHSIYAFSEFLIGRIDGRHPETAAPATLKEIEDGLTKEVEAIQGK